MGTTSRGIRYPEVTDRVADGALAMQNLAADVDGQLTTLQAGGATLLGSGTTGTNVTDTSLNYVTAAAITVTVPSGLGTGRRILVLATSQLQVGTVGNVDGVITMTDSSTGSIAPGSIVPWGGYAATRAPSPTGAASYNFTTFAAGAPPAAGSHTWTLRFCNKAAGSWTSYFAGMLVVLL